MFKKYKKKSMGNAIKYLWDNGNEIEMKILTTTIKYS